VPGCAKSGDGHLGAFNRLALHIEDSIEVEQDGLQILQCVRGSGSRHAGEQ
jgi:hypothetical protein